MKIRPDFSNQEQTVIMDAGTATDEIIAYLKGKALHYIVVSHGKGEFTPEDTADLRKNYKDDGRGVKLEVKRLRQEKETWLLCRNAGYRQKDRGIRGRQENLFHAGLVSARDGLIFRGLKGAR